MTKRLLQALFILVVSGLMLLNGLHSGRKFGPFVDNETVLMHVTACRTEPRMFGSRGVAEGWVTDLREVMTVDTPCGFFDRAESDDVQLRVVGAVDEDGTTLYVTESSLDSARPIWSVAGIAFNWMLPFSLFASAIALYVLYDLRRKLRRKKGRRPSESGRRVGVQQAASESGTDAEQQAEDEAASKMSMVFLVLVLLAGGGWMVWLGVSKGAMLAGVDDSMPLELTVLSANDEGREGLAGQFVAEGWVESPDDVVWIDIYKSTYEEALPGATLSVYATGRAAPRYVLARKYEAAQPMIRLGGVTTTWLTLLGLPTILCGLFLGWAVRGGVASDKEAGDSA